MRRESSFSFTPFTVMPSYNQEAADFRWVHLDPVVIRNNRHMEALVVQRPEPEKSESTFVWRISCTLGPTLHTPDRENRQCPSQYRTLLRTAYRRSHPKDLYTS